MTEFVTSISQSKVSKLEMAEDKLISIKPSTESMLVSEPVDIDNLKQLSQSGICSLMP